MVLIRPIGKLLSTDAEGFLIDDCDRQKISFPWTNLVEELRQTCLDTWKNRLSGLYLRGSVPRGLAILGISDLDCIAVLQGEIATDDRDLAQTIALTLKKRHLFVKKIEIILINSAEIQQLNSPWPAIIQTQSLCIEGEDLKLKLPKYKPGIDLLNHALDWQSDLNRTLTFLSELSVNQINFATQVKARCGWITRRMVRTGFELIMERDQSFTRDLYPCYERFSVYFPEQRSSMRKALELAIEPSENRAGLLVFLRQFGRWLAERVEQQFPGKFNLLSQRIKYLE